MRHALLSLGTVLLLFGSPAFSHAQQTIVFNTDPFAGSTALTTPGRQIVANEVVTTFDIATDKFAFNPAAFNFGGSISFANGLIAGIPASGANAIVLQTFDNDANPATAFAAGVAANLLADQITSSGAGVFIYFNSGLDLARLVYSTDLSDNTADLKILARLTNIAGQNGRDLMPTFTAANFALVPEPSALLLFIAGGALLLGKRATRKI